MINLDQYINLMQGWYLKNQNYLSFLDNLDPSLLQNVVMAILMLLIFIGELVFSDTKSQKSRGEFSKMVINDEIMNISTTSIIAISFIVVTSFFRDNLDGQQIHSIGRDIKIIIFISTLVVVYFLMKPIFNFQVFLRGKRDKFEINFLKNLGFSKILKFRNKVKSEKMIRAWNSFWGEKTEYNEREFIDIFISHIDDNLQYSKYETAIELGRTFLENIENRETFDVGYKILPKVFEWHEYLWNKEQKWMHANEIENKIENSISQKHLPTFRKCVSKYTSRRYSPKNYFWDWSYFGNKIFPEIVKILLKKPHNSYELFKVFTEYIQECEKKLSEIKDEKKKDEYFQYIRRLFGNFCPVFFENISEVESRREVWEHNFPRDWKIISSNSRKNSSHIILYEFMEWAPERIFKKEYVGNEEKDLTNLINGLFPDVDSDIFPVFLMLLFSYNDIKRVLEKKPNFYIFGPMVTYSGSLGDSDEEINERLGEMLNNKGLSQKQETIHLIINYFRRYWNILRISLNDSNRDEWNNADSEKKDIMLKNAVKINLTHIKEELESSEIITFCNENELRGMYRKNLVELMELLILENNK